MKKLFPLLILLILLVPTVAHADGTVGTTATTAVTVTWVTVLGVVLGFLSMAYNTGSLFSIKTVPQAWLPYLGLTVTFIGGIYTAEQTGGVTLAAAILAGFNALIAVGGGAATHSVLTAHKSSRGVAASKPSSTGSKPPTAPVVATVILAMLASLVMLVTLGATQEGCSGGISPNTQNIINASEQLGACVETTYYTESNLSPPANALAIAVACADNCGADVADLVESLIGDDSGDGGTPAAAPKAMPAGAPSRGDVVAAAKANASIVHTHALAHRQNAKAGG